MSCLQNYLLFPLPRRLKRKSIKRHCTLLDDDDDDNNNQRLVLCVQDTESIKASLALVQRRRRSSPDNCNTSVSSVSLSNFPSCPTNHSMALMEKLLVELKTFSNLKELEIDRNSLQFPQQALASLLRQGRSSLVALSLGKSDSSSGGSKVKDDDDDENKSNSQLKNNDSSIEEEISVAIQNHPSLERVFLGPRSIDAYLPAVATCTKLQSLEIRVSRSIADPKDTIKMICQCLQNNSTANTLKSLSLRAKFQGLEEIGEYLQSNTTLEELNLSGFANYNCANPPSLLPIVKALQTNRTLKRINFVDYHHYHHSLPEDHGQAFVDMIRNNMVLESIVLAGETQDKEELQLPKVYEEMIPFYCRLNKMGRRHLLQNESATINKDWIETIIANHQDHQAIYYLLSMNPTSINV